jgi:RNA-directed DNA polymerase
MASFERIDHPWLLAHVPMNRAVLRKWLQAGFLEQGVLHATTEGTPQGGIISPALANLALDGLEPLLRKAFASTGKEQRKHKVHLVRYADDFVITGASRELLEQRVRPLVAQFLMERGLELSEEKTHITPIEDGFDFLGQTIRRFKAKVLLRPSRKSVARLLAKVRTIVRRSGQASAGQLIVQLNPLLRGWAMYHRHSCSAQTFARVDQMIFWSLWRWARRRHRGKASGWVQRQYFHPVGRRLRVFSGTVPGRKGGEETVSLFRTSQVSIRRHIKVRGEANPYDPSWELYYEERLSARMTDGSTGHGLMRVLWEGQKGLCPHCHQKITVATGWHIHHRQWRVHGGSDALENLDLVHPHCHRQIHSRDGRGTQAASRAGR